MRRVHSGWVVGVVAAVAIGLSAGPAHGQITYTWNNAASSAWVTAAPTNWTPNTAFPGVGGNTAANTDVAVFATVSPLNNEVGIDFSDAALTANTLSLGAINYNLSAGTGVMTIGNSAAAANSGTLRLNGASIDPGTGGINNVLLAISNGATRDLTIQNVAAGGNAGNTMTLQLGIANGVFYVNTGRTLTVNTAISEATAGSRITIQGGGTAALGGTNTFGNGAGGGLTVSGTGTTLSVSSDANLGFAPAAAAAGYLVLDGGTLSASASFTLNANRGIAVGPTTGTGGGTIDVTPAASTLTYNGIIANNGGTGNLVKTGAGTLVLGGANTYGGTTTINGGTVQLAGGANRLPTTTTVNLANLAGTNLNLNNQPQTLVALTGGGAAGGNVQLGGAAGILTLNPASGTTTFSGVISGTAPGGVPTAGAGSLVKNGAGTVILAGANLYQSGTTLNAGTLQLNTTTAAGSGTITIPNSATLAFGLSANGTIANVIDFGTGTNPVTLSSAASTDGVTVTLSGNPQGGNTARLINVQAGSATNLATNVISFAPGNNNLQVGFNSSTFAQGIVVTRGVLRVGTNSIPAQGGSYGSNGGTLDVSAFATFSAADNTGNPTATTITGNGALDGSGNGIGAIVAGNTILSTLVQLAGSSRIGVNNGTTAVIPFNPATGVDPNLVEIGGTGRSLTKVGGGTLSVQAPAGYTGGTTVLAGVLSLDAAGALPTPGPVAVNGGILRTGVTNAFANTTGANTVTASSGGIFQIGVANSVPDAQVITLSGGTLSTANGANAIAGTGSTDTVGRFTITANSAINLGTGLHTLTFSNAAQGLNVTGTPVLTVNGYGGLANALPAAGGTLNFVTSFGSDATAANAANAAFLNNVQFFAGNGTSPIGFGAIFLPSGASIVLVPAPEPTSVLAVAAAGLGVAGWVRRRRQPA